MRHGAETRKVVKHLFTPEEDDKVKELVSLHGLKSWKTISRNMKNRTARQCRERWKNYLSPNIKNGPWSDNEDELLEGLVEMNGTHWAKIAQSFDNRTDTNVKNRWLLIQRSHAKKVKKDRKKYENRRRENAFISSPEGEMRDRHEDQEEVKNQYYQYYIQPNEELKPNPSTMIDFWDDSQWDFTDEYLH